MDPAYAKLLELIGHYQMPTEAVDLLTSNPPLVIASVSGGGKDTIAQYIQDSSQYRRIVTTTTRPMRLGETNGIDYWFVDLPTMLQMVKDNAFIEVKQVHEQQISG